MRHLILAVLLPLAAGAQSNFTVLYQFTNSLAASGDAPYGTLICSSNVLYGATVGGGSNFGVIFKMNGDGTGYTNLHTFSADSLATGTNGDGIEPRSPLLLLGNTLYGTAQAGGVYGFGTVFAINTGGTGFTNLHSFSPAPENPALVRTNYDGANPYGGLVFTNGTLYGTADHGGADGYGTIFALSTNGENFTILKTFAGTPDGETPLCGLTLFNGFLFGSTAQGGSYGSGSIFRMTLDGSKYATIYNFTSGTYDPLSGEYTNSDGEAPQGVLLGINDTLFGTADIGGSNDFGTVFKLSTNGGNFVVLHTFSGLDGKEPTAGLVNSASVLYGTASNDGAGATNGNDGGTLFQVNTNGSGFVTLQNFSDRQDGAALYGGVVLSGNTLYGAAYSGGVYEDGDIYSFTLPAPSQERLLIQLIGTNIVCTWTNPVFALQEAPTLTSAFTNVPGAASPYTNAAGQPQAFFRLISP